jgi:cellobiose phosphorylase
MPTRGRATVFGHLRRALEFNLERTGRNGCPAAAADWNDCIRLGYQGESLFVAPRSGWVERLCGSSGTARQTR